jgi:L-alanine-DL-glutamate epimerase-like enolase superfamily enzyme
MKITEVKVWLVEGVKYNWTMLKVCTDIGHTGVGEATNWPGSPIIEAATRHVGERVIGLRHRNNPCDRRETSRPVAGYGMMATSPLHAY